MNARSFGRRMAAMMMILTLPIFSFAGNSVPYKDKVSAVITNAEVTEPNAVRLTFTAAGQGTHVGKFTTLGVLTIANTAPLNGIIDFTGENTLTAANGDKIFIKKIFGELTPAGGSTPGEFIITIRTEFFGGTGRFVNASGGFVGEGRLNLVPGFVGTTFTGEGEGAISKPRK